MIIRPLRPQRQPPQHAPHQISVAVETVRDDVPAPLGDKLQQLELVKPAHRQPLVSMGAVFCEHRIWRRSAQGFYRLRQNSGKPR
jgi:hypothetical protein